MAERTDHELLAEFARSESEEAFAALVKRYVNLVYSTALRFTGNAHSAEEITQAVFMILARKTGGLSQRVVLSGWLYQTARLTAANFVKGEMRRQRREQEAYMQSTLNEPDAAAWEQIAPLLDDAMGRLGETDRNAVVLRFFENKTAAEVGAALQVSEAAAHKRTTRALDKLRKFFDKRGVSSTTTILGGAISGHSVQEAPAALAKAVAAAMAKGATPSISTLTLVKGVLKIMAWTKAKTAIAIGAGILLIAGTATLTVEEVQAHKTYPWQVPKANFGIFYKMAPAVKIVPTRFSTDGGFCADSGRGAMGIAQPLQRIIQTAYGNDDLRTIIETDLPKGKYDFLAKLVAPQRPHRPLAIDEKWKLELQKQIQKQFGIAGSLETRETNVLVLKAGDNGVKGFKISHTMPHGIAVKGYSFYEQPVSTLVSALEREFQIPIVDQTGLTNTYDFALDWHPPEPKHADPQGLKKALEEQLGLELVPTNMPIEMLVVQKAK